ncbi:MAG: delta-60 repeat domain-containing protein, partial [Acidobacteriota bacterium]
MKFNTAKTTLLRTAARSFAYLVFFLSALPSLAAPGDLDPKFGIGGRVSLPNFLGQAMAIQSDGKIVVGGYRRNDPNIPGGVTSLARFRTDGSLDLSFGIGGIVDLPPDGVSGVSAGAVAIQSDGKILTAGGGYTVNQMGEYAFGIGVARYNADGSFDSSFGTGGKVVTIFFYECSVDAVAIQSDGKIVTVGYHRGSTSWDFLVLRYNKVGVLDPSFGDGGEVLTSFGGYIDEAKDVAIQADGKIVATGRNRNNLNYPYDTKFALARYNTNGSLDTSFGTGGKVVTPFGSNSLGAYDVAVQSDGKIVAAGSGGDYPNNFALARYNTEGALDSSFGSGGKVSTSIGNFSEAYAAALQSDGKIVAAGFGYDGSNSGVALAKYYIDGSLDTSFGTGGKVVTPFPGGGAAYDVAIQSDGKIVSLGSRRNSSTDYEFALFRYLNNPLVTVANVEELYAAVNNPANAGSQIVLAPGVYMLSAMSPGGDARPNGGRLELQENMSLLGVVGDRGAAVIDAADLPPDSYSAPPIPLTAAVRIGRGTNSIEWLTVRNAVNGNGNIGTDLNSTPMTYIRVAHISATNSRRGIDFRNYGAAAAGRVIQAEVVDNDIYDNRIGQQGEGMRFANNQEANGGMIFVTLNGNRSHMNLLGAIFDNNGSNNSTVSVVSAGNRFYENGLGAAILVGLSQDSTLADGNTVSFMGFGDAFENNNGASFFDFGGLLITAAENTSIPNGASNNTANVELRNCRFSNNQVHDIAAFGARSTPASIGLPGVNNRVNLTLLACNRRF